MPDTSITPHVLKLAAGHISGPFVDESGCHNIAAGIYIYGVVVEHVSHSYLGQDLDVLGTSCECSFVLEWIHIFRVSLKLRNRHFT